MEQENKVIGWGMMPCLHCGEIIKVNSDIHLCNVPRNQWLNKQDKVYVELQGIGVWDMKTGKIVRNYLDKKNVGI